MTLQYHILDESRIVFSTTGYDVCRTLPELKRLQAAVVAYGPRNVAGNEVDESDVTALIDALVQRIRSNRKAVGA